MQRTPQKLKSTLWSSPYNQANLKP
jgi:hypothetical protein